MARSDIGGRKEEEEEPLVQGHLQADASEELGCQNLLFGGMKADSLKCDISGLFKSV